MTPLRRGVAMAVALLGYGLSAPRAEAACPLLGLCSCSVSTTAVNFGAYNVLNSSPTDSTGQVQVDCTLLLSLTGSYEVRLSGGLSGNPSNRVLRNSGASLSYNLYTNASRSQVWGDGAGGTTTVTRPLTGLLYDSQVMTIYGRIPARQNVRPGVYSDVVTVTVVY